MPRTSSGASLDTKSDNAVRPMPQPVRPGSARPIDTALRALSVSRHSDNSVDRQTRSSRYLLPRRALGSLISRGFRTRLRVLKCAWIPLTIARIIVSAPLRVALYQAPALVGGGVAHPPHADSSKTRFLMRLPRRRRPKHPYISAKIHSADKATASLLRSRLILKILG